MSTVPAVRGNADWTEKSGNHKTRMKCVTVTSRFDVQGDGITTVCEASLWR